MDETRTGSAANAGKASLKASYAERRWQSDVIVDLIKQFGFPYIALNPGASYRGLHDSLVNYGGNNPPMLLCQHEKIAVQIAHGYAKATGKPMVAIVHDVVGLLHATMGIYYAYVDRAPVFVIGATGPMDESKRRPFIDWIHTANVQGEQGKGFHNGVALAETVGAAVYDVNARLNFPNRHSLNLSMDKSVFRDADLILALDTRDWEKPTHIIDRTKRATQPLYPATCEMIELGFGDIGLSKWSMDFTRMPDCSLRVLGDTLTPIAELKKLSANRIGLNASLADRIADRTAEIALRHC